MVLNNAYTRLKYYEEKLAILIGILTQMCR